MKMIKILLLIGIMILIAGGVEAQYSPTNFQGNSYRGDARFSNYYNQPDFQKYYQAEGRLGTYYPILGNPESCVAREDVILQVSPIAGCEPAVVRSDLLADQNVPVFCQIEAIKANPLVDVKEIRNIRFKGDYPGEYVVGTGFHPARAALRTGSSIVGSPIVNNIGYVVVVLRQQEREGDIPDVINFTLSAQLEYNVDNALGVGRANFLLEEQTDSEWNSGKFRQSFWDGRFFLRLEESGPEFADVAIYEADRKVTSVRIEKGKTSREIYLPGSYCQYSLTLNYADFQSANSIAKLRVGDDLIDVYKGSRFLNDKCNVVDVRTGDFGDGGVDLRCGSERFELSIGAGNLSGLDLNRINERELALYFPESVTKLRDLVGIELRNDFVLIKYNKKFSIFGSFSEQDGKGRVYDNLGGLIVEGGLDEKLSDLDVVAYSLPGFKEGKGLVERKHENEKAESYFDEAIKAYEQIADDFPLETESGVKGESSFGEQGLFEAIDLAALYGKEETEARLINKFLDFYPESRRANSLTYRLNELDSKDFSLAGRIVEIDNDFVPIKLVDVRIPKKKASADFYWDNQALNVGFEDKNGFRFGNITLDRIVGVDRVRVSSSCGVDTEGKPIEGSRSVELSTEGPGESVCGRTLKLRSVNLQELADVRVVPNLRPARTETNFTVGIGIEKRAIELTPDKAKERADELQETINKWESISTKLGQVVKGLKAACFATSTVLTVKNFISGLDGEGAARQKVMGSYWREECGKLVSTGEYDKLSECYYDKKDEINSDVEKMKALLNKRDREIENIENSNSASVEGIGGLFGEKHIDGNGSSLATLSAMRSSDGWNQEIKDADGKIVGTVGGFLGEKGGYDKGFYNYGQVVDTETDLEIINDPNMPERLKEGARKRLNERFEIIRDNVDIYNRLKEAENLANEGYALPSFAESTGQRSRVVDVRSIEGSSVLQSYSWNEGVTHSATFTTNGFSHPTDPERNIDKGEYVVGLGPVRGNVDEFSTLQVFKVGAEQKEIDATDFAGAFNIGLITPRDQMTYNNRILDPEVKFYETEPYRGLPAVVPFDLSRGWYAAARQTLPGFGNIGSYESSGKVASFSLCNVGRNGRIQFFEGIGDDQCQVINLNTGQPLDEFPGLSSSEAKQLIRRAINAINQAAQQYGSGRSSVSIEGQTIKVGRPAANIPGVECAEFMSPDECNLMFNVCDPVICPASRCDLGGAYPVSDVIQTGIVGSALLCLPNADEGIVVPVCLTGIQAGVDSYLSILKSHQACLRESAETGRLVGICDEITSVYTCEFFWRQVAPATDVLVPKLFEVLRGENSPHGGGEYITVKGAWDNTQNSIDYFTDTYAVNSLDAFKLRTSADAGSTFCRAFIGGKGVDGFDGLIEPDSPHQFYAWFSSTTHTTATVPATAQYKVFYHIFAGNDFGVSYSVYLKDPPESSYYQSTPTVQVDAGFVPRGEAASETIDFTAPEGYKQLCVRINGDEECGFKQVSTDFAVNYLRDQYVSDELSRKDIQSEKECVSGAPNYGALLQPNIQAGLEEAVFPEAYDRGVIRICSTENPGSATDPLRFVDVGYCGDEKLRCWLDKSSVSDAITQNNELLKNKTLSEVESFQRGNLELSGEILSEPIVHGEISRLRDEVEKFNGDEKSAGDLINSADFLLGKAFFNDNKAHILLLKALVYDKLAERFYWFRAGNDGSGQTGELSSVNEPQKVYSFVKGTPDGFPDLSSDYYLVEGGSFQNIFVFQNRLYVLVGGEGIEVGSVIVNEDIRVRTINERLDPKVGDGFISILNELKTKDGLSVQKQTGELG